MATTTSTPTFKDLNLNSALVRALDDLGYTVPSTIQLKAFNPIMSGKDVLGIAQTGTGKTFAYLLPLIRMWQYNKKHNPEMIVVVPTRELVMQVVEEFEKLTPYTNLKATGAFGGVNIKPQILAVLEGVDLIVATPGRLLDLILNGTINAKAIKKLVIDEVDEMLDLGFRAQLKNIIDLLPEKRQTLMFSATTTDEIDQFISANFHFPVKIEAAPTGSPLKNISQVAYKVPNFNTKINFLEYLLANDKSMSKVLVFAGSKRLADEVHERLEERFGDELAVIHSNKAQNTRFKTVEQFERGESRILIASDLIARGLDVAEVTHVINLDVPAAAENYMHRIGRTGRADKKGVAISFIAEYEKANKAKIESLMGKKIAMKKMPEEVEVSDELTVDEQPTFYQKPIEKNRVKTKPAGQAFHEKKDKNKKVNVKVTRADAKKIKYGKRYVGEHRSR